MGEPLAVSVAIFEPAGKTMSPLAKRLATSYLSYSMSPMRIFNLEKYTGFNLEGF
jgi:hypothetical protein